MDFFFSGGAGQSDPAPGGACPLRCRLTLPPLYPAEGGACLLCRPPTLPLGCFVAPIPPPTPFPSGEGGDQGYFHARGFAPCIPCTEPSAALTVPVVLVPGGIPCREPLPVGFAANYGFSSGDARGEAPCIRKLKVSPFPPGRALCERGSGGWGRQRQLTAGAVGDKEGKPPCGHHSGKVSRRPAGQAPTSDTATAGRVGNKKTPPHPKRNPFHS